MENTNHTFAICAYKESKYLEECIKSLKSQTIKTNIIMCTSTPNDYIKNLAKKYEIKLYINTGKSGIGLDWNFAVSQVQTDLVTIAHQDDIYCKNYVQEILKLYEKDKDFAIAFGNYRELKNGEIIPLTGNLKIKKILLKSLSKDGKSKNAKQKALKFGDSICCPCVTLNIPIVGKNPYKTQMKCDLDWLTWYELSKLPNSFMYTDKDLMYHRIHEESTTSHLIENHVRLDEDYEMFCKFWPKWMAKILMKFYQMAVKTNS